MSSTPEANKTSVLSDRLLQVLQERVRQRKRVEIVEYFDELVPKYVLPVAEDILVDDKLDYRLPELLGYHEENFVRNMYRCILKREVEVTGLQEGMEALQVERCSRIQLLGRLRYSDEGERHGVYVRGLRKAYFLARLQKLPIVGGVVSSLINLNTLWHLPSEIQWIELQLHENENQLAGTEKAVSQHLGLGIERLDNLVRTAESEKDTALASGEPQEPAGQVALTQVLRLSGEEFIEWSYNRVFSRSPNAAELANALHELSVGEKSKVETLGALAREAGKPIKELNVVGLPAGYRLARLERIPLLGFFLKLSRRATLLSRLDTILEYQGAQVSRNTGQIVAAETRLMRHYNSTVTQVKREVVDALRSHGK